MKNSYHSNSFMIVAMTLLVNIAYGQQLAARWTTNVTGYTVEPKNMALVPTNGHRYLVSRQVDHVMNFVHLDENGHVVWSVPDDSGFYPIGLVYNAGKIFLYGSLPTKTGIVTKLQLRMYSDVGAGPALVWDYDIIPASGWTVDPGSIIADSRSSAVTISWIDGKFDGTENELRIQRITEYELVTDFDHIGLGRSDTGAKPEIFAMCDDYVGNLYITGLNRYYATGSLAYMTRRTSQFVFRFGYDGGRAWLKRIDEPGFNYFGVDIAVGFLPGSGSHVYTAAIRTRHGAPATENPLLMVTKFDQYDGDMERSVPVPARTWDSNSKRRPMLLADYEGHVTLAYNAPGESTVTVNGFNIDLVRQWTHAINMSGGAHHASIISPAPDRFVIAVNNRITFGTRSAITTINGSGAFIDRLESTAGTVLQMIPDFTGKIHTSGTTAALSEEGIHEQLLEYRPRYRAFPNDLFATPWILIELQSQGRLQYWGSFNGNWTCGADPCTAAFTASLTESSTSWKETITKPTTIALPPDNKFKTFGFSIQDQVASKVLFEVDRTLIDNGIKSLKVETDWNAATMTVTSTTDGPNIPLTLTLIGKNGNVIGELKTTAPTKQVFKDRVAEPVSFIRITAPPVAPIVNIFPNPSNGKFKVTVDENASYPLQLAIHDGQGNKVHQQVVSSSETDVVLNNPLPGFYVLRMTGDKVNITKQLQIK